MTAGGLFNLVVADADDAGDLPAAVLELPDHDELSFAGDAMVLLPGVQEAMDTHFHCAVVADGIDLEGAGDEFAFDLAAEVVLDGVDGLLAADGEAVFVVVELGVIGPEGGFGFHVAAVDGVEEFFVEASNGLGEIVARGDRSGLGEGRHGEENHDESKTEPSEQVTSVVGTVVCGTSGDEKMFGEGLRVRTEGMSTPLDMKGVRDWLRGQGRRLRLSV